MRDRRESTTSDGRPPSPARPPTCILGIDPGLNITGYAVLECARSLRLCEGGVVRSRASADLPARVAEIYEGVREVIEKYRPGSVALEQLYSHYKHPRTAILMAHARGAICLAAAQAGSPVLNYSATQVKKLLTGSGRASKRQMQLAIRNELRLSRLPEPADVADALALALCHYHLGVAVRGLGVGPGSGIGTLGARRSSS